MSVEQCVVVGGAAQDLHGQVQLAAAGVCEKSFDLVAFGVLQLAVFLQLHAVNQALALGVDIDEHGVVGDRGDPARDLFTRLKERLQLPGLLDVSFEIDVSHYSASASLATLSWMSLATLAGT